MRFEIDQAWNGGKWGLAWTARPRFNPGVTVRPWVALLCACAAGQAMAYRPFNGTDAETAGAGEFELELGPVGYLQSSGERSLIAPAAVLNLGVAEGWEVVLEGRTEWDLESGSVLVDDTAFSVKHVLRRGALQGEGGPSVAAEVSALLPTFRGEPGLGASAALVLSVQWALLTVHLNGAAALTRALQPGGFLGLIVEGPRGLPVRPVVELFADKALGGSEAWSALAGAIWEAREGLRFDAAARAGRVDGMAELEVRVGLTWTISLFPG